MTAQANACESRGQGLHRSRRNHQGLHWLQAIWTFGSDVDFDIFEVKFVDVTDETVKLEGALNVPVTWSLHKSSMLAT